MKKYELLRDDKILVDGKTLYRIKALKDFGNIKKGYLGGYIQKESNLCQKDLSWIYVDARVYGNAEVHDKAKVYGNAEVFDSARVYGNAMVHDKAKVCGRSKVYRDAIVYGDAKVSQDGCVCEETILSQCECISDLSKDLKESIRCQTGLGVFNNKIIAYKQVNPDLTSFYDSNFQYEVGKEAVALNPEISNDSCASGLHFSNMNYWNHYLSIYDSVFLVAEIDLDDVITVQEGKIRCKKAKILGTYKIEKP